MGGFQALIERCAQYVQTKGNANENGLTEILIFLKQEKNIKKRRFYDTVSDTGLKGHRACCQDP